MVYTINRRDSRVFNVVTLSAALLYLRRSQRKLENPSKYPDPRSSLMSKLVG
jgi:hypothetical protein